MSDERLRELFRGPGAPGPDCPSPEAIWDASAGEADPEAVELVLAHVQTCASCAEDWRLAHSFDREADGVPETVVPLKPRRRLWAGAALFVAAAAATLLAIRSPDPEEVSFRGGDTSVVRLVGAQVPASAPVVRWQAVPGATTYEVAVFDHTLKRLAGEELTVTSWTLPAAATQHDGQLYWRVTAHLDDGRELQGTTWLLELTP